MTIETEREDPTEADGPTEEFDFDAHSHAAVAEYLPVQSFFEDLSLAVKRILEEAIKRRSIQVVSVFARAKEPQSFGKKAGQPSEDDPSRPKYARPLEEITDLAGVRIIAYFPASLAEIDALVQENFIVLERSDKGEQLIDEDRLGYQSVHYLVKLSELRSALPEYEPFANAIAEIQVRTILQHAWAEIEHDIRYKATSDIPSEIRHRFTALAGLLEIADREFQAIQDADRAYTELARVRVEEGRLSEVEITGDALKAFLNKRLGPDGRMKDWSYAWIARRLRRFGFQTIEQISECISGYDDDKVSRAIWGTRLGQLSRFELMILAGVGPRGVETGTSDVGFGTKWQLDRLAEHGIAIGDFKPRDNGKS